MNSISSLENYCDAIVMLTWSNWFTELRSNRYHYATRFAKALPVIFVQPDLDEPAYFFEHTNITNIVILHVYNNYNHVQNELINAALLERGCIRPIFWVYNAYFNNFLAKRYSVLNVFHGTEDYLASESRLQFKDKKLIETYTETVNACQVLIAVSEGVKSSFETNMEYYGQIFTITNGCDYKFYSANIFPQTKINEEKIVFYQGNIYDKLNYDLLLELATKLPDWTFNFCGKVVYNESGWVKLCKLPNVNYLGLVSVEELRSEGYKSTVGIIPFEQSEWLVERSFPLKTFEYLATGLPVVSIPITSILPFSNVILFAETVDEFIAAIQKSYELRNDEGHTALRLQVAATQDYDIKFETAKKLLESTITTLKPSMNQLKILVLYDSTSVKVSTIRDHLSSFSDFSKNQVYYLPATKAEKCPVDLNAFDVLVIHYSVSFTGMDHNFILSQSYINAVKSFGGYKVLFLQDQHEGTEIGRMWITNLGIHKVYTCVPEKYINYVYPKARFPQVAFTSALTGCVPIKKLSLMRIKKLRKRNTLIGYRSLVMPHCYGRHEELNMALKVKEYCDQHNIPVDIECNESKIIHGKQWYQFLLNCRATLMTEITPKIFESILLKTAIILLEVENSNFLIPDTHCVVLKKDFSNLSEIINRVQDNDFIERITEAAYHDIILSGKFSHQAFINEFDQNFNDAVVRKRMRNEQPAISCASLKFDSAKPELQLQAIKKFANSQNLVAIEKMDSFLYRLRYKSIAWLKARLPTSLKIVIKKILLYKNV